MNLFIDICFTKFKLLAITLNKRSLGSNNKINFKFTAQKQIIANYHMYLSQPKLNLTKLQPPYLAKQNLPISKQPLLTPNKFTIYPPKMHRVSSTSSVIHFEHPTFNTSLSKEFKGYRDFSKTKIDPYNQPKNSNMSLNATYDLKSINKEFDGHRYSCSIDIDRNSDNAKSTSNMVNSIQNKTINTELQNRVKLLEQKMKKNQQSVRFYTQQIQHFKHQFSSSTSHLLDSINTNNNILTISTRQPLKQVSPNTLTLNSTNKQNRNNNYTIPTIDSVTNSPKDSSQLQKKLKLIDQVKKDVKKLMGRQQNIKGDMKLFQASIRDILTGFREYLTQSVEGLAKMQEKTKKRLFEKVTEEMEKRFREWGDSHQEKVRKMVENVKIPQVLTKTEPTITKSHQKCLNDPILLKLKQQSFCLIKRSPKISPFQTYQQMIKRNIYEAMGRTVIQPTTQPSYPRMSEDLESSQNYDKVTFDETQVTYFMDEEGYLLDRAGYYLLGDGERIRLGDVQIDKLKENGVLKEVSNHY